jgi:hypothetical protein
MTSYTVRVELHEADEDDYAIRGRSSNQAPERGRKGR